MFMKGGDCYLTHKMYTGLTSLMDVFNLRQGCILIAVHQITLSSFLLITSLVGITHVGQMLSTLHNDMEDDAERRGLYEMAYGATLKFLVGDQFNNQRRFATAQHLVSVTVIILYTCTILTSVYLLCSISLLHGAVRYKRGYMIPWICAACLAAVMLGTTIVYFDNDPGVLCFFNGHNALYRCFSGFIASTYLYAICCVSSFALETGTGCCRAERNSTNDAIGERLLLLDHTAHSSLLSAAQINKLSHATRTQFV